MRGVASASAHLLDVMACHISRRLEDTLPVPGTWPSAESVAVKPDGSLFLLDKFGYLHIEAPDEKGTLGLLPAAAYVGPGRPLGFHFSQTGDLIICDSLKVRLL